MDAMRVVAEKYSGCFCRSACRLAFTSSGPTATKPTVPANQTSTVPVERIKQQRLDELLKAYKADLITPTDYHRQRAKILSEP